MGPTMITMLLVGVAVGGTLVGIFHTARHGTLGAVVSLCCALVVFALVMIR